MITVATSIAQGSGEVPKNVGLNSILLFDASSNPGTTFDWDLISKPKESSIGIDVPNARAVRLGPIDKYGVYLVKLIIDQFLYNPQMTTVAINVPESVSPEVAPDPLFDTGGSIRNFSFELPGVYPGTAAYWETIDDNNILATYGGISRGLIIPQNFDPTSGERVFCMGDDQEIPGFFGLNTEFSITQEVDLTNATFLTIDIKFKPPKP